MRRREFIKMVGIAVAVAWPSTVRSRQGGLRLIGVLHSTTFGDEQLHALRTGLRELGYVQDRDYALIIRAAENKADQLSSFAADLIDAKVSVILALGGPAPARIAKAATTEIPIVFAYGGDPVRDGLVTSLSRPRGNATGITFISTAVSAKRLELLRQLIPGMRKVAMLVNPKSTLAELEIASIEAAAPLMGLQLQIVNASSSAELDAAFAIIAQTNAEGLLIGTDPAFGLSYRDQIISLGTRYKIPAISPNKLVPIAGGLISYGASLLDAWRQSGAYVGRIFKGEKPADLPVMQPTKFEMVINLKTAKAIGIVVPAELIARADEVIE